MNDSTQFDAARQARRISEQAVAWYIEQQEPLTERQRAAFLEWLRASPRHVAEYFAVAQMHGDFKAAAMLKTITADELAAQAGRENPVVMFPLMGAAMRRQPSPRARRRPRVLAIAASVAVAALMAGAGLIGWRAYSSHVDQRYAGNAASVRLVTLPDNTLVQLDRDSLIDVHFDGRSRRIEVIRGRALFDVGKDIDRPMFVSVGGHVLQDIGTVFDVARGDTGDTLTVISGRVRVLNATGASLKDADLSALGRVSVADLTSGEQISLGATRVGPRETAQIATATAWLPSEIRFQHETIGNVARRFNAYTSKPLVIDDEHIAAERISGIFHADNPQAFAAYLGSLPNVRVVQEDHRVRVVASR